MSQPSIDSFFSGGGGKSVSWKDKPVGTTVSGTIKRVHEPQQITDPATKKPVFKPDGVTPKMQVRIDLATNERDPMDPDDDGSRGLYVQGWMQGAIGDAIRKSGAQGGPQVGAQLSVALSERTPNDNPAMAPINKFVAQYVPPSPAGGFFEQQAPQQFAQPPVQQQVPTPSFQAGGGYVQQPQAQAAPAPAAATLTPEQMAAFMNPPAQAPAAAPAAPQLVKPNEISQVAWDQMDASTKQAVVNTLGGGAQGDIPF